MQIKSTKILITGAVLCALAVCIGAFGAHGLKEILLSNGSTETFKTGVLYHIFHGLGILLIGIIYQLHPSKYLNYASTAFLIGVVLFSGSLYLLSITQYNFFGPLTPLGGLFFILGWLFVILAIKKPAK